MPKRTYTGLAPPRAKKPRRDAKNTTAVSTSIPRGINLRKQVLAKTLRTTLRYNDVASLVASSTGDACCWAVYRMSVYDPEYALGGTQPRGFNQMESLYHDYVVDSVSIEVRFHSVSTSHRPYCFIAARGDPSASINWADINENPDRVISKKSLSRINEAENNSTYLQMTVNPSKMLGITDPTDSRIVTSVATNPESDYYYLVGACDPHADSGNCTVQASITLTYQVRFLNPKSLNASA